MPTLAADVVAPPLPRHLQVEVTGACNLRCAMCLVAYRPAVNRREGTMSLDTFTGLLDDLPDLERVTLQGLGEPLLVPHLEDMVAAAATRGARVGFNTNGMLLGRDRARALIEAGLSWLHVSLDGARAETHEGIRAGVTHGTVVENLRGLLAVRAELGADAPHVEVVFVAMRRNVAELPALVRDAVAWGVDRLRVQNLSHDFADADPAGSYAGIRAFAHAEALWGDDASRAVLAEAGAEARRLGLDLRLPDASEPEGRAPGEPGCTWPWDGVYVTHDGLVQPCCMVMGADRLHMGRVGDGGLPRVWASDGYRRMRDALLGDEPPAVCRGCALYRRVF